MDRQALPEFRTGSREFMGGQPLFQRVYKFWNHSDLSEISDFRIIGFPLIIKFSLRSLFLHGQGRFKFAAVDDPQVYRATWAVSAVIKIIHLICIVPSLPVLPLYFSLAPFDKTTKLFSKCNKKGRHLKTQIFGSCQ